MSGADPDPDPTVWTMIQGAARGDAARREHFAARYLPLVRGYLGARWRGSPLAAQLEDAAQEVFVACLGEDGVLERADPGRAGGFRAFLFGAVRNVARRFEARWAEGAPAASGTLLDAIDAREEELGRALDREWALCMVRHAAERHRRTALARGAAARTGVEVLRLRFVVGLPVREIATRLGEPADSVHRRYRRARADFRRALREVVAFHQPHATDLDAECGRLLGLLGAD